MDPITLKQRLLDLTGDDVDRLIGFLMGDVLHHPKRTVVKSISLAIEFMDDVKAREQRAASSADH